MIRDLIEARKDGDAILERSLEKAQAATLDEMSAEFAALLINKLTTTPAKAGKEAA